MQPQIPSLNNLSRGERLFLARHRAGDTQEKWARRFKVNVARFRSWEMNVGDDEIPEVKLEGKVTDLEACVLLRKRNGLRRPQLADKLGCSPFWVSQMENGREDPKRLLAFWGIKG